LQGIETRADIGIIPDKGNARQTPITMQNGNHLPIHGARFMPSPPSAAFINCLFI
jgi:hypothetical protein